MESIRIDILNPKVKALLKNLDSLGLIKIQKQDKTGEITALFEKFRSNAADAPGLDDITKEVEAVRKNRYEK